MRCFLSELLIPEDGDSLPWACCQHCRRRKDCPIACDQSLRFAARRKCAAAQLLEAEADRLMEAISRADNVNCLLDADETVERALSHALCQEISRNDDLCTPRTTSSL